MSNLDSNSLKTGPFAQTLQEISHLLQKGQSVALIGPPKTGRTALLRHLSALDQFQRQQCVLVYVNCAQLRADKPEQTLSKLAAAIGHTIQQAGLQPEATLKRVKSNPTYLHFDAAIRRLDRHGLTVILLLDDFEHLSENPRLDLIFFNSLRATASRYRLLFVTTSTEPLVNLTYLDRQEEIISSPFFNIFAQVHWQPPPRLRDNSVID